MNKYSKEIICLATKIKKLEDECQAGNHIKENMEEMAELISTLDIEDVLLLYECISDMMLKN